MPTVDELRQEWRGTLKTYRMPKSDLEELIRVYTMCQPKYGFLIDRKKWYDHITENGMKQLMDRHGLARTGTKDELWDRLEEYYQQGFLA
jgi:hypothetical protein